MGLGWEKLQSGAKLKGRGRPRKNSTEITYAELGFTRQQVYEFKKLAEIPYDEFNAYMTRQRVERKKVSVRGILVHFGKRNNVVSDDIFAEGPTADLAKALLAGFERIVPLMTRKERRWVIRALEARLRMIDFRAEMSE